MKAELAEGAIFSAPDLIGFYLQTSGKWVTVQSVVGSDERRDGATTYVGVHHFAQVGKERAALQATGDRGRE